MLRFVADAHSTSDPAPLTTELLDQFASIVGCLAAAYAEHDEARVHTDLYVPSSHELRHPPPTPEGWGENPFSFSTAHAAGRWSSLLERRQRLRFETTSWAAHYGVVDCLWRVFPLGPGRVATLVLHRQEHDFGEREEAIVTALEPHLAVLIRNSRTRRRLADFVAAFESDHGGGAMLLLDEGGAIERASPAAVRLLDSWFGTWRDRLPGPIAEWHRATGRERLRVERGSRRLVVEALTPTALALIEEPALVSSLTTRELEILRAVAAGQLTKEIAEQFWITPATVSKHLDRIYRKLDVTSRTAALAALEMTRT